jgi:hypothetical protein
MMKIIRKKVNFHRNKNRPHNLILKVMQTWLQKAKFRKICSLEVSTTQNQ